MRVPNIDVEVVDFAAFSSVVDYGLNLTGVPIAWGDSRGKGIKVAVVDTGWSDHAALEYDVKLSAVGGDGKDAMGHGTHVTGIIGAKEIGTGSIGVAPECTLAGIKAVPGSWATLTEALRLAIDWGADIVNFSCGAGSVATVEFKDQVERAYSLGVILVASAGNTRIVGVDTIGWPARLEKVIPVAAIGESASDAPFSATGSELERGYCMPGVKVYSCWLNQQWAKCSGTSMAAPHLTGVIAILLAKHATNQGSTPIPMRGQPRLKEVVNHLDFAVQRVGDPLKFGKGYIDAAKL